LLIITVANKRFIDPNFVHIPAIKQKEVKTTYSYQAQTRSFLAIQAKTTYVQMKLSRKVILDA